MTRGGIILCGGRSSRMGTSKAELPFGAETMLERVVRLVSQVCQPVVIVAGPDQALPKFEADILVARDRMTHCGPLEGLAVGLAALPAAVPAAFATGCDTPLLVPKFVERMFALLGDEAAAVPVHDGFVHPLSAVYRRGLIDVMNELLASGRMRPMHLFDIVATRRVEASELSDVDPQLWTLKNVNTPEDYHEALACAGFAP